MNNKYIIEDFGNLSIYDGLNVLRIINTMLISLYQNQITNNENEVKYKIEDFLLDKVSNITDNSLFLDTMYLSCLLQPDDFKFIAGLFSYEIRGQKIKLTTIKDIKVNELLKEFIKESYSLLNSNLFQ